MGEPRQLVTISAACTLAQVSRRTMYNWITKGKVEYARTAGGAVRIFVDTIVPGVRCPGTAEPPLTRAEVRRMIQEEVDASMDALTEAVNRFAVSVEGPAARRVRIRPARRSLAPRGL